MIVFHGSDHIVEHPVLGGRRYRNDFGPGFYTTENSEIAKEWACAAGEDGFCNRYALDLSGLSVLDLNSEEYSILNWLAILARYRTYWQRGSIAEEAKDYLQRNFFVDPAQFDVVIGYRADDSYFSFAQDFISGAISLSKLSAAMKLGKLGEQVVLKSEKAFEAIHFETAEAVPAAIYHSKKVSRDRSARREYRMTRSASEGSAELFILDILREEIKNGDPRLR